MIPIIDFNPLHCKIPQIAFGCGSIVGKLTFKESAKIIESALDLGIRYFDVAPSYGMGTAEEVLGKVIGNAKDVFICTKIGIPRGVYNTRNNIIRKYAKPVLDRFPILKSITKNLHTKNNIKSTPRMRYDFSEATIRSTIETSLKLLKRDNVDVFLAHEPHPSDLTSELSSIFVSLQFEGLIKSFGVGIGSISAPWMKFGDVWQSAWSDLVSSKERMLHTQIFHGIVRYSNKNWTGVPISPSTLLSNAISKYPNTLFIVSASKPTRLQELLMNIDM